MALTVEKLQTAESNEALFNLLIAELQRLLPDGSEHDCDLFDRTLDTLPQGLRAMVGVHSFDISMAMDSLDWHFGNHNDERDLRETLNGLRELELPEIANMFEQMWEFMKPHMAALQSGDYDGKRFSDWLVDIGADDFAKEKNEYIWEYCKEHPDYGFLSSWLTYARKYPEHCIVTGAQA